MTMQLTTVENVKQYLGISNSVDDALFERLVNAASAFIQTWLNRDLDVQTYTDNFDGSNGQSYMFKNYPVTAVSAVVVGGQTVPVAPTLNERGYRFAERRLILDGYTFSKGLLNCSVSYTAGYSTVPLEVEQACIEMIANRYREKDRIGLVSKGLAGETTAFSQKDMPDSTKTILRNYKKVVPN